MSEVIRNAGKFNAILLFAAAVTTSLFYSMQLLIMSDESTEVTGTKIDLPEITLPEIVFDVLHATPKPEEVVVPPKMPDLVITDPAVTPPATWVGPLAAAEPVDVGPIIFLGPSDGNAMPIAQVQPVYPARARVRGLEGTVVVEFDVSENGTVINPRVLLSEPEGVFERASLNAIERWKYQPRIIDGEAVMMRGVQTKFSFTLGEK